jgi:hypothetical protein
MKLNKNDEKREVELLTICKTKQGEFLLPGSGSGSWATTYSDEFINSAAELYSLYKKCGSYHPQHQLSQRFRELGIKSCRGAEMSLDKVKYLFKKHLSQKIQDGIQI